MTERLEGIGRNAEIAALRNAMRRLGDIGTGTIDRMGMVGHVDDGFEALIGAQFGSVAGLRFTTLFDPQDRAAIEEALAADDGTTSVSARFISGGTGLVAARLVFSPYFNGKGELFHAFVMESERRGK